MTKEETIEHMIGTIPFDIRITREGWGFALETQTGAGHYIKLRDDTLRWCVGGILGRCEENGFLPDQQSALISWENDE